MSVISCMWTAGIALISCRKGCSKDPSSNSQRWLASDAEVPARTLTTKTHPHLKHVRAIHVSAPRKKDSQTSDVPEAEAKSSLKKAVTTHTSQARASWEPTQLRRLQLIDITAA